MPHRFPHIALAHAGNTELLYILVLGTLIAFLIYRLGAAGSVLDRPAASAVTLHDDVLVASRAWGAQMRSSLAKVSFFSVWFSVMASFV